MDEAINRYKKIKGIEHGGIVEMREIIFDYIKVDGNVRISPSFD